MFTQIIMSNMPCITIVNHTLREGNRYTFKGYYSCMKTVLHLAGAAFKGKWVQIKGLGWDVGNYVNSIYVALPDGWVVNSFRKEFAPLGAKSCLQE